MTYHVGMGVGMSSLGFTPCDPHITCDGCGVAHEVMNRHDAPYKWFLDNKAPPGWKKERKDHGPRKDFCARCRRGKL
jgi:hypothetical protein